MTADKPVKGRALFVSAPVKSLVEGIYRENRTVASLAGHGDFGLGTFNDLDGELVMLEGRVYQLRADGQAYAVPAGTATPYACVNFFSADTVETFEEELDLPGLQHRLQQMIPSPNLIYAVRIDGRFSHVRTRSVPRQDSYRPLVEVAREQPEFDFRECHGTMAGYITPSFMADLTVPGLHLHFLTEDRQRGGHLLACTTSRMTVSLQHLPRLEVELPVSIDYMTAEFTRNLRADLDEAE